jgi:2-methylcitrate dehydratase PrpD
VWAALAAREGFTADSKILESPGGFFEVFNGPVPERFTSLDTLLAPSVFEEPGLALKRFPCNYALHRNVDAFAQVMSANGLATADIEHVECLLPPGETRPIMRARPATGLEAKFSLEYVLTALAIDGRLGFETFTDEAVRRPEILAFLPKVEKRESAECAGAADSRMQGGIGQGCTRVTVTTRDGRRFTTERAHPKGAPEEPLTWDEIGVKFNDCARHGGFPSDHAAALLQWLRGINTQDTLAPLTAALRHSAEGQQ